MLRPLTLLMLSTAMALSPVLAQAESRAVQESRFINGTVGAIAGAMVGGPIGLIAGAALGYSMGPEIAGPQATFGPRKRVVRHARRGRHRGRSTKIVIDCAVQANQDNAACVDYWAKRQQRLQPVNAQQMIYPQQAMYPQQPVYMAPAQHGYSPLPAQIPAQQQLQLDTRGKYFNPRQNPMVPPPTAFGDGSQYSAALSGPNAPGQQGASGGYSGSYTAPAPQGYGYGQVRAAPVPLPR